MRSKEILSGLAIFALVLGSAAAQDAPTKAKAASAPAATGLQTGPATVVTHWSRNKYPTSIPEGATYYIVEKNDTAREMPSAIERSALRTSLFAIPIRRYRVTGSK